MAKDGKKKVVDGYLGFVQQQHDEIRDQLEPLKKRLPVLQSEYDEEYSKYIVLRDKALATKGGSILYADWPERNAQENVAHRKKSELISLDLDIKSLQSQIRPFARILNARNAYDDAKSGFDCLTTVQKQLEADKDAAAKKIEKLQSKISSLENDVAEALAAAAAAIADDPDGAVPETFGQFENQLALTRTALAGLKDKQAKLIKRLEEVSGPEKNHARDTLQSCTRDLKEVELYQKLWPFMADIAQLADLESMSLGKRSELLIKIPEPFWQQNQSDE